MSLDEINEKLDRILAMLGDKMEHIAGRRNRSYPWDDLDALGKFQVECSLSERDKVQKSISANAIKRYGKGAVSVVKNSKGVLAIKKGVRK